MMYSDMSNAAVSHSQGPTPGRIGDVSEPSCPDLGMKNFNQQISFSDFGFDEQVFQHQQNGDAMQPASEQQGYSAATGYEVSAAKGFRARWRPDLRPSMTTCLCLEAMGRTLNRRHLQLAVHLA